MKPRHSLSNQVTHKSVGILCFEFYHPIDNREPSLMTISVYCQLWLTELSHSWLHKVSVHFTSKMLMSSMNRELFAVLKEHSHLADCLTREICSCMPTFWVIWSLSPHFAKEVLISPHFIEDEPPHFEASGIILVLYWLVYRAVERKLTPKPKENLTISTKFTLSKLKCVSPVIP